MNNAPKYWVACSGGVDSVALLRIMHEQKKSVGILHCNFQLRDTASDQDEVFVRELAKQLDVPIRVYTFDTKQYGKDHKMNTQLAARELRYTWFDEIIQKEKGFVLLAHHYDDQLETFFLQLRRGGKVKGLAGMPVFKAGYLRPLLKHSKNELIGIAKKNNWKWREDISNSSNDYMRNWYRNEVLPWLKTVDFPLEEVVPLMHSFQEVLHYLERLPVPRTVTISDWLTWPDWYKEHLLSVHGLGMYSEKEITRLTKAEKGKFIGNDVATVWNEGKELFFVKENPKKTKVKLETSQIPIADFTMNTTDLFLDADKIYGSLATRKWKAGDRFQPLGMKGEKLIGKFLKDRKVPAHEKEDVYVLVDQKDHILGVFGFGVSEEFKITESTKMVWCVKIEKS